MTKHPDIYMPFYGSDFFAACDGLGNAVTCMYLRLLWYYWSHLHCQGYDDHDEELRAVARCDIAEWPNVRKILFDSGSYFYKRDGKFFQKRCDEVYFTACRNYEANQQRTAAATAARWRKYKSK
jgi:uncharacterized protein YdaU (DUF1376 family)